MTTGNIVFQTPWRNIQGYECQITSDDWKDYSFHVGNPHNISVGGFISTVAANIAMRDRIMVLKALSKKPEPVEPVEPVEEKPKRRRARAKVTDVAAVTPIEPKQPTYSFTDDEDAALVKVPAVETEDW